MPATISIYENLAADERAAPQMLPSPAAREKEELLRLLMRQMHSVLVAYSGGVDSTYLAAVSAEELGERSLAVLGISPSVSAFQREEARNIAASRALNFETAATTEMANSSYRANPDNRCYFCKDDLYGKLAAMARERSYAFVIDGTNADDLNGHRPGRKAAEEHGVRSPLAEAGLFKSEVRQLSRAMGLTTFDKPASPCLASRIAHGVPVTIARLGQVEKGEAFLRELGFREFRVRTHGKLARLEFAADELDAALDKSIRSALIDEFIRLGFKFVTVDLEGFRSGSLNIDLIRSSTKH